MALLKLEEKVASVAPAGLYRAGDELAKQVTFVGNGDFGTGKTGPVRGPAIMRAAHNTVVDIVPGFIVFRFDPPGEGDDLEGISGPGDSGGPALIEVNGKPCVAGVSAFNQGESPCVYGTMEYYGRVSSELRWIDDVMAGRIPPAAGPKRTRYRNRPDGQVAVIRSEPRQRPIPDWHAAVFSPTVKKLIHALNEGDSAGYLDLFQPAYVDARRAAGDPLESMLEFVGHNRRLRGRIVRIHPPAETGFAVEGSVHPMRPVTWHFADGKPGYFGVAVDRDGRITHLSLFVQDSACPNGATCTTARPVEDVLLQP